VKKPDNHETTKKVSISLKLTPEAVDAAKRATFWTPGATLSGLVEDAILREVDRLEKRRGEPFPRREVKLKTGRPMK